MNNPRPNERGNTHRHNRAGPVIIFGFVWARFARSCDANLATESKKLDTSTHPCLESRLSILSLDAIWDSGVVMLFEAGTGNADGVLIP